MRFQHNWRHSRGSATLAFLLLPLLAAVVVKSHSHRVYGGYVQKADHSQFATERERIVITHVSVLADDGESMRPPQDVWVENARIVAIEPDLGHLEGARILDGRGRYLVPGLVDMHVHLRKQPNDLLLYVANGVTHIRDLAGSQADLRLREEIRAGRIGPRLTVASPMLFTGGPMKGVFDAFVSFRLNVPGPERAEAMVESLAGAGYDAIKTYADIDLETFRAVNRAAAERGIHTVGHLPMGYSLEDLATTEQREIAHIEEIIKLLQQEFRDLGHDDYANTFALFAGERADAIIDDLLANDITVNSTLRLAEMIGNQAFELTDTLRRLPLEYANPAMVEGSRYVASMGWLPGRNQFEQPSDTSARERERIEKSWAARAEAHRVLCRRMVERGVRIVAGTDATSHLMIAGFSMHDELQSLVGCGMSPAAAIRAATAVPAALMEDDAGVIDLGKRADLLLLSANPLEDIANTTRIDALILDGRLIDRAGLDSMLKSVREAHAASRKFELSDYQ